MKKNKKKGFTLVELLAVIVILAVVILIAVTAVIPRMNKARRSAFKDEALAFIKAANEKSVVEDDGDGLCYTVESLKGDYIDKKNVTYSGIVCRNSASDDNWYIWIKEASGGNSFVINGKTSAEVKALADSSVGTGSVTSGKTSCPQTTCHS